MIRSNGQPQMVSVGAVVTRADGTVEDLGVVAFAHRNPLLVVRWRLTRALRWLRATRLRQEGN